MPQSHDERLRDLQLIHEPRSGSVVRLRPGTRLGVRFHRLGLTTQWFVADHPGHLLPLSSDGHELSFLAFGRSEPYAAAGRQPGQQPGQPAAQTALRLIRCGHTMDGQRDVREVRELTVLVTDAVPRPIGAGSPA